MPLHHVFPYPEIFVYFVFEEEVDLLELAVHGLLDEPLLAGHEVGLAVKELGDAFAADRHVLLGVALAERDYAVVVGVGVLVQVEEVELHLGERLEKAEDVLGG